MKNLCAPTISGEIKKARAANYNNPSNCLFEFIDNAIDAKAKRIRIDIREKSGTRIPHKIMISDDCPEGISKLIHIFSWTYDPGSRQKLSLGEYGTGFKSAAVNIADKLTLFSKNQQGDAYQVVADWQDMADENRWEPRLIPISNELYGDTHPFKNGSTFVLESLRYDILASSQGSPILQFIRNVYQDVVYFYRYFFKNNDNVNITIRGVWEENGEIYEKDCRDHPLLTLMNYSEILESEVHIFRDSFQFFRVYFHHRQSKKWEYVQFIEKRKNGNSVLKCHETVTIDPSFVLVDVLTFRSFLLHELVTEDEKQDTDPVRFSDFTHPCTIDIIRDCRVVGKDLSLRNPRADPIRHFVKHELYYENYAINTLLGIHYNKSNNGNFRENDLRYTIEHLQFLHEKEFFRLEKILLKKSEEINSENSSDTTIHKNVSPLEKQDKRKSFSEQVKISTITAQESRDSVLDFVLRAPILLLDYDHKNGIPAINTEENCQALSVITHSVKTRCPKFYQELEGNIEKQVLFIKDLLNCITRSKIFVDAWRKKEIILIPSVDHASYSDLLQSGLFTVKE